MQINLPDDWLKTGWTRDSQARTRLADSLFCITRSLQNYASFVLLFFFWLPSCATSMRQDFRLSLGAQFSLTTSLMCRTIVVGLIYTTRSTVKSWRMLVAHDSRKQKSYRLNRPLHYYILRRFENFSASRTIAHGSFRLPPRSLAKTRGWIETLRSRFFSISREPQTSRSHVTSALPSGLRFEVYVSTARSRSRGKWFTARFFAL